MKDTGWRQAEISKPGDQERLILLPTPDEEFPEITLRLVIFQVGEGKSPKRWRAHASLSGNELFRLYAPNVEDAKKRTEEGLRKLGLALVEVQ